MNVEDLYLLCFVAPGRLESENRFIRGSVTKEVR
jgi:hypothetical protein